VVATTAAATVIGGGACTVSAIVSARLNDWLAQIQRRTIRRISAG
jgi:hypothetical protein